MKRSCEDFVSFFKKDTKIQKLEGIKRKGEGLCVCEMKQIVNDFLISVGDT